MIKMKNKNEIRRYLEEITDGIDEDWKEMSVLERERFNATAETLIWVLGSSTDPYGWEN